MTGRPDTITRLVGQRTGLVKENLLGPRVSSAHT